MRNKLKYTPTEAIKAVEGLHRKKLYAMMKDREIAYEKEGNTRLIDVNELIRVFSDRFTPLETDETEETVSGNRLKQIETPEKHAGNSGLSTEVDLLRERISDKDQLIRDKERIIADLREDRDQWRSQAQRLLLTDQRHTEATTMTANSVSEFPATETVELPSPPVPSNATTVHYGVFALLAVLVTGIMYVFREEVADFLNATYTASVIADGNNLKQPETEVETPENAPFLPVSPKQSFPPKQLSQ